MGDYNADSSPDLDLMRQVAYGFSFFSVADTKSDQFSTLTSLKVYKFTKRIGSNNLRVLVDPSQVPGPT